MSSTVEQIKARLTIIDVVGSYLTLEKAGANYRARCPFHTEKTPSFFVSPARETYHCFGCNRGGDIFTFVEEIEGLDFLGALKVLALRAGVPLEPVNHETANAKERLHAVVEAAVTYYTKVLTNRSDAQAYLVERGLTPETIASFRLGFAPAGWRELTDYLLGRGFTELDLNQSGLVARSNRGGRLFDRFRNRIMFPITDGAGRPIAFSGRLFGAEAVSAEAKYINSPDTLLYDKSRALYLFDRAKLAIRRAGRCVLVEGQFDAVLSHQAGIVETIAVSGTALSGAHLDLIHRLTNQLIMAFDGDEAGIKASDRAITLALERGFEVRVVVLPAGRDPAEIIQESSEGWKKMLNETVHVIDFLIETVKHRISEKRQLAHAIEREVYPYLAALANPIDQAHFIRNIAELVRLPETVIRDGVGRAKAPKSSGMSEPVKLVTLPARTRRDRLEDLILGFVAWRGKTDEAVKKLVSERWGNDFFTRRQTDSRDRESEQSFMAEVTYAEGSDLTTTLAGLLDEWQTEVWRAELAETVHRLKELDSKTESKLANQYLKRCKELSELIFKL
ncbi:MAG: DNA primase [Candidatus Vogelbacteria bacterium]